MSWFWTSLAAIGLGILANELCDLSPWLARKLLLLASRLEGKTRAEAELIHSELRCLLDEIPGKLTKLVWSLGRLSFSGRLVTSRSFARRRLVVRLRIDSKACAVMAHILEGQPRWLPRAFHERLNKAARFLLATRLSATARILLRKGRD